MQNILSTAKYALDGLTAKGAAQAQCYVEEFLRTDIRLIGSDLELMRTYTEQQLIIKAIDADKRLGTMTINSFDRAAIDEAVDDCLTLMSFTEPDENACFAEVTNNGSFTSGTPVCEVEKLIGLFQKKRDQFADKSKKEDNIRLDDKLSVSCIHYNKKSAIFNTNGVALDQHIGWYDIDDGTKIVDLDTDIEALNDYAKPYDTEAVRKLPDPTPLGEKFVGTVLLMPSGVWHLWWLSRMCVINDFMLTNDDMKDDACPWYNMIGQKAISDKLTIEEHLLDPRIAGIDRFTSEGYPTQNISFFENGVVTGFPLSHEAAKNLGRPCNAKPHDTMTSGRTLFIKPGETPVADMLKNTKHGMMLGSFHCCPQDKEGEMTGFITCGYLIEDGKITRKVQSMISCNFFDILNNVSAVSKEVYFNGEYETPWIAFEGVHMS